MNEYELLRAEMMQIYASIMQYNCVLYSAVAAIFVFVFDIIQKPEKK